MSHLLFVYGTLRKGENNHHFIQGAECIESDAYIFAIMYDTGYGYPAVILDDRKKVTGELYSIDKGMLIAVDQLEEYEPTGSENVYERVNVTVFANKKKYEAIVYVAGPSMHRLTARIQEGDWVRYRKHKM